MDDMFINGWLVDHEKNQLIKNNSVIQLSVKSCALLTILHQQNGNIISRDYLLTHLWKDVVVSDDSLTNLISITRQQLKSFALDKVLKTIPKQGYQLKADIVSRPIKNNSVTRRGKIKSSLFSRIGAISVLSVFFVLVLFYYLKSTTIRLAIIPLTFSDTPSKISQQFDLVIHHQVSQISGLETIANSYVAQAVKESDSTQQVAKAMSANYWLEGSLVTENKDFIITVQLVSTKNSSVLFSQQFVGEIAALNEDAERISKIIATNIRYALQQKLSTTDKHINAVVANERCENYLEIIDLYATNILVGVEKVSQQGEQACHDAAIANKNDAQAINNLADWYLLIAKAHARNEDEKRSYLMLSAKYSKQLALLSRPLFVLHELHLSLERLRLPQTNFEKAIAIINRNTDLFQSINTVGEFDSFDQSMLFNYYATSLRYGGVFAQREGKSPSHYFTKSEKIFTQALQGAPKQQSLLHNFARLKKNQATFAIQQNKDPQTDLYKAIELYKMSLENRSNTSGTLNNLANAYSTLTKWLAKHNLPYQEVLKQTERTYQQSLANSQKNYFVYNNISDLYGGIAEYGASDQAEFIHYIEQGLQATNEALVIKADYDWPLFNQGHLRFLQNRVDFTKARFSTDHYEACIKSNEQALARRPNISGAYIVLAKCEYFHSLYLLQNQRTVLAKISVKKQLQTIEQALVVNDKLASAYMLKAKVMLLNYLINNQKSSLYSSEKNAQTALFLAPNDNDVKADFLMLQWYLQQQNSLDITSQVLTKQAQQLMDTFSDNEAGLRLFFQKIFNFHSLNNDSVIENDSPSSFYAQVKQEFMLTEMQLWSKRIATHNN